MNKVSKLAILLVADCDSNVGYAWWLMGSFWVVFAENDYECHLAYPTISSIPGSINTALITIRAFDFRK